METTTELNHTAQVEEIPLAQSGTTSCLKGVSHLELIVRQGADLNG